MYRIHTFSIKTWCKINVEAVKHNYKKWINEKHLEKAVCDKNLASYKTPCYPDKLKKKEDMKYKIVKIFSLVENLLQKN